MADFQIFSDGACDIGFEKAAELNIQLIPFYVSIDHENYYKEILEISLDDYFRFMTEEKGYPKTSLPSIQDYIDAFTPALEAGKDVLCLTMTRSLTASQESAMTAKAMLEEDFPNARIEVINSWVATGAQMLLLMEMARMQKNGKSIDDVLSYVEKARADARIHFMVGDLSYLEVGGRIGKLATLSGGLLKIKPILRGNKDGYIVQFKKCRGRKAALNTLINLVCDTIVEPENQIIGSGTVLDSARLRCGLSNHFNVAQKNVHAYVFGEHGDSSFIPWSRAHISAIHVDEYADIMKAKGVELGELDKDAMLEYMQKSGGKIIANKGATFYAVAVAVTQLCGMLVAASDSTATVSTMMHGEYGIEDVCLSTLSLIGPNGHQGKIPVKLTDEEVEKLRKSAETLKNVIAQIEL